MRDDREAEVDGTLICTTRMTEDEKPLPPPIVELDAPPPPQKDYESDDTGGKAPQLPQFPPGSLSPLDTDLSQPPPSPMSPTTPHPEGKKKSNPLTDLIETEKGYVELLTAIIRKVAAAWSRSNLPPPQLDTMFRCIESIYKANRSLLTRLKDIGTAPSSPKALGDLLMRWIEELGTPYESYATKYCCGFDFWEPVSGNAKLPNILAALSSTHPPPSPDEQWKLDDLFLLPRTRIKYYRKLYSRLLKNTASGRSDYRLLVAAVEKLEFLSDTLNSRENIRVGEPSAEPPAPPASRQEIADEVVIDLRTQSVITTNLSPANPIPSTPPEVVELESETNSARVRSVSDGNGTLAATSFSRRNTLTSPISDLEGRLATERTLDIFTMKPKIVRLQMSPPTLTFKRELRCSVDVVIHFTPRATGQEWVHQRGHIFLLSDLFLLCERMSAEERADSGPDGPDMWLCYPPLAGKVLRVAEVPGQDNVLEIAVMRKETIYLHAESPQIRQFLLAEFKDCIEFASSLPPPSKDLPPPVPPLHNIPLNDRPNLPQPSAHMNDPGNVPPYSSPLIPSASPPLQASINARPLGPGDVMAPNHPPSISNASFQASASMSGPAPTRHHGPGDIMPAIRSSSASAGHPQYNSPPVQAPQPQFGPGMYNQFSSNYGHPRPPSEPGHPSLRNSPSTRSLNISQDRQMPPFSHHSAPPLPMFPQGSQGPPGPGMPFAGNRPPQGHASYQPTNGFPPGQLSLPQPRPLLPSMQTPNSRAVSMADAFDAPSPPGSPVEETLPHSGPVRSTISAQMKCKVFLKQHHAQWKSLGAARLKLYRQDPTNIKQLVVEADARSKSVLISTIILTDGVERVGKTGVAIELSDKGTRTGIVYMIQLRNETSAGGFFDSLIAGSDRSGMA